MYCGKSTLFQIRKVKVYTNIYIYKTNKSNSYKLYSTFHYYFSASVVIGIPSEVGFSFVFSSARFDGFVEEMRFVSEMRELDFPTAPKSLGFICCPCVTVLALLKILREGLRLKL